MKRRYRQDPKTGKLIEIKADGRCSTSGTFAVGDLPDIMKDKQRHEYERAQQQKRERLQTIIEAVNRHGI